MIRRLLSRLLTWLTQPMYDVDETIEEYWRRQHYDNEWWNDDRSKTG